MAQTFANPQPSHPVQVLSLLKHELKGRFVYVTSCLLVGDRGRED